MICDECRQETPILYLFGDKHRCASCADKLLHPNGFQGGIIDYEKRS